MGEPTLTIVCVIITCVVFAALTAIAGHAAAAWFGIGFLTCAVLAFWEAGRNRRLSGSDGSRMGSTGAADDSACRQASAQNTQPNRNAEESA